MEFLRKCKFTLLTSYSENFGNVVIESKSTFTPCFVTSNLYISEYLNEDFIIDQYDHKQAAAKISTLFRKTMKTSIKVFFCLWKSQSTDTYWNNEIKLFCDSNL